MRVDDHRHSLWNFEFDFVVGGVVIVVVVVHRGQTANHHGERCVAVSSFGRCVLAAEWQCPN